jgi:type IV secretory pathway VirB2 component (pilin)
MTLKSRALLCFALTGALVLGASPALAQTTSGVAGNLGSFLQNIIDMMNSTIVRLVAILAVIVTGFAWLSGHFDLRRAMTVVAGIMVAFGASTIVGVITGGAGGTGG